MRYTEYFSRMGRGKKWYAQALVPISKKWKLTQNELDVLLFLHNNPDMDRAADIVSWRGISKSHVSLSVNSLETRGLIVRAASTDRRAVHLALTESGRAIAQEGQAAQRSFFQQLYQGITPEEFALWQSILDKIDGNLRHMEKQG